MPGNWKSVSSRWLCLLCSLLIGRAASVQAADPSLHADAGRTLERSLEFADRERTYLLHLPADMRQGTAVPLVIALHGLSMDGRAMEALTGFDAVADDKTFAVAYPDGLGRMWRFWERTELGLRVRRESGYVDDLGFIGALIDELVAEGTVDPRRVYVTGLSNGAYMSNRLAVSMSQRIAAIAPVAGTMSLALANLDPPRKVPVLYIHGTDDRIVGYDGVDGFTRRKSTLSAEELVDWWADCNGCRLAEPARPLEDAADDGCRVIQYMYPSDEQAPVVFYVVQQGGHTWPGGQFQPERLLGPVCRDFNASAAIWEFFSHYELPATPASE